MEEDEQQKKQLAVMDNFVEARENIFKTQFSFFSTSRDFLEGCGEMQHWSFGAWVIRVVAPPQEHKSWVCIPAWM
jgi:hypothetical protein